jgi:hypothetical protein
VNHAHEIRRAVLGVSASGTRSRLTPGAARVSAHSGDDRSREPRNKVARRAAWPSRPSPAGAFRSLDCPAPARFFYGCRLRRECRPRLTKGNEGRGRRPTPLRPAVRGSSILLYDGRAETDQSAAACPGPLARLLKPILDYATNERLGKGERFHGSTEPRQ